MSTTSKVMYLVRVLDKVLKYIGSDMEPNSSIFFPPKPYSAFYASFNYFLPKPICSKVERNSTSAW
jgi:hypothetical protein